MSVSDADVSAVDMMDGAAHEEGRLSCRHLSVPASRLLGWRDPAALTIMGRVDSIEFVIARVESGRGAFSEERLLCRLVDR